MGNESNKSEAVEYFKVSKNIVGTIFKLFDQYEEDKKQGKANFALTRFKILEELNFKGRNYFPGSDFNPDELANKCQIEKKHPYTVLGEWVDSKIEDAKKTGKLFYINSGKMDQALAHICLVLCQKNPNVLASKKWKKNNFFRISKKKGATEFKFRSEGLKLLPPETILTEKTKRNANCYLSFALLSAQENTFSVETLFKHETSKYRESLKEPEKPWKPGPIEEIQVRTNKEIFPIEDIKSTQEETSQEIEKFIEQVRKAKGGTKSIGPETDPKIEELKTLLETGKFPNAFWTEIFKNKGRTLLATALYQPKYAVAFTQILLKTENEGYPTPTIPSTLKEDLRNQTNKDQTHGLQKRILDFQKRIKEAKPRKLEDTAEILCAAINNFLEGKGKEFGEKPPKELFLETLAKKYPAFKINSILKTINYQPRPNSNCEFGIPKKIIDLFKGVSRVQEKLQEAQNRLEQAKQTNPILFNLKLSKPSTITQTKTLQKRQNQLETDLKKINEIQEIRREVIRIVTINQGITI